MDDGLPEPPIPAGMDVRDLDGFMLNVERLLASELWALSTGEEFKAAMALWCRAWKQMPGGSLPDDDKVLAAFSGAGRNWSKVRAMALRGFVKCSDGRLYHRVLCEDVKRAAQKKAERRERTKAATEARKQQRNDERDDERHVHRDDERDDPQNGNVTTSQGQGQGQGYTDADASVLDARTRRAINPGSQEIEGNRDGRKSRRTRIAADWQPDRQDCDYAAARGHDGQWIGEQADAFRNRCLRDGAVYADWHAAWRTWVGHAEQFEARDRARFARPAGTGRNGLAAVVGEIAASWRDG